jgi:hypothetical protein
VNDSFNVMTTGMNLVRLLPTVAVLITLVEHSPHHKVEGLSLAAGRQKVAKIVILMNDSLGCSFM